MKASVQQSFRQRLLDLRSELQDLEALSTDARKPAELISP
jgi:hypothetical protein